jgi:hypothetical protein
MLRADQILLELSPVGENCRINNVLNCRIIKRLLHNVSGTDPVSDGWGSWMRFELSVSHLQPNCGVCERDQDT